MIRPILLTSGEPAGIGPDICLDLDDYSSIVIAGDIEVLRERAALLGKNIGFTVYQPGKISSSIQVLNFSCQEKVKPGIMNVKNSTSVLRMLEQSCRSCLKGEFSALVTAPVNKYILQQINPQFYGHTEFFQQLCQAPYVVMMLADSKFRVALVTTHIPLRNVADAITKEKIIKIAEIVYDSLKKDFGILFPKIAIAGLNPHAGENGLLGDEEQKIIIPAIVELKQKGIKIDGPFPADSMFINKGYDAYIAMYHDQGLSVLKYATFGKAANISLGLPIIRTSVDHGTALDLAGTGKASSESLKTAIQMAGQISQNRESK